MKIELRAFSGIAPRYSPELLSEQNGQTAQNISIKSGKIHPEKPFTIKTPDTDYVTGQVNDDQYNRLYFLDDNGNLMVAGFLPAGDSNVTARKVDITAPGIPGIISVSSPILDSLGGIDGDSVIANYGSTSWKAVDGVATHIYGIRELAPIDDKWISTETGGFERTYQYNPWDTTFYWTEEQCSVNETSGTYVRWRTVKYGEERWSISASVVADGEEKFRFVNSDDGVVEDLLDYNGNKVGTLSAYIAKVSAAEYPEMSSPTGAVLINKNTECGYLNDTGRVDADRSGTNQQWFEPSLKVQTNGGTVYTEEIGAGNLKFVIERNYTAIDLSTFYVATAVNDIGEESPPSEISQLVTRKPDEKAVLSITPSESASEEGIQKYRIYRASGGTSGNDFFYVGEASEQNGEIIFNDIVSNEELGEQLPIFGSVPKELEGIAGMSGGFMAAYKGKDLYFSEPYHPYVFPWEYNQSVPFDIVGIAVRNNYLYVMTNGPLYAFVGDHPQNIVPLAMRFDVPCISRKSIAHVNGNIVYAGTTGLVMIANGGPTVFTDQLYTLEQYKDLHFENCITAGEYDGKYFAVFADKILLFDFSDNTMKHTTLSADAFTVNTYSWNDGSWENYRTDFVQTNTSYGETMIMQDFSGEQLNGVWKSRDYITKRPVAFTCARVRFEDPAVSVTLKLYAEGAEVFSGTVQHNKAFRLPVMRRECRWSVQVSGTTDITSIELAESMAEM